MVQNQFTQKIVNIWSKIYCKKKKWFRFFWVKTIVLKRVLRNFWEKTGVVKMIVNEILIEDRLMKIPDRSILCQFSHSYHCPYEHIFVVLDLIVFLHGHAWATL